VRLAAVAVLVLLTSVLLTSACSLTHRDDGPPWPDGPGTVTLSADQRRVADELVNVFEYSSTSSRYDVVNDLGDGRGYTCGKIGFTTSSTEVRDVVTAYVAEEPGSALARYLPRLRELAANGDDDTSGLPGFRDAWASAAGDPRFRAAQDGIADRLTFDPALAAARRLGLRTPLGVAILYDTAVQHGVGDDPDGLPALITRTGERTSGDEGEKAWLQAFLDVRAEDLRDPHDKDTRAVWAESVDRVDALRDLVDSDRHPLHPPITVKVDGDAYELR
jgi:chitosanase